ncbi:MAG: imidazole glycerol phosphate synthase [Candidatus Nitrosotenuis sp.]|nr:imidazole glycerol phosphate synthase [Candidatus Nitrosotenuis sp.]
MTLTKRIIPCLDVANGRVVKGLHFESVKDAGDPVLLAEKYSKEGADELVFLDITASQEQRETIRSLVSKVAQVIDIPFTVGGGVKTLQHARDILLCGADKVAINTGAVKNPQIITELMNLFGKQCVVVAIDAKRNYDYAKGKNIFGKKETGIDAIEWAKKVQQLGAGEILLTSIDKDGTKDGYDIILTKAIVEAASTPVIASGGCGEPFHMLDVFKKTDVDAALAASIFHYETHSVDRVKEYLKENNVEVRLDSNL